MSSTEKPTTRATLGLGGLTMNAMALIAPGAFLWLTFFIQSSYGAPMASQGMWFGIFFALILCFATAIAYAELSKLYPGAGSSYFFAEQAFLGKTKAFRFARIAKFIVGWASHLYYWVYPGLMVGVTALVVGYVLGQLWPNTFSATVPSPIFMVGFSAVFAVGVAYICFRGVTGTTAVNTAINVIQIAALVTFSLIAIGYRLNHPQRSVGITLDPNGAPITKVIATDKDEAPMKDAQNNFVFAKTPDGKDQDFTVSYSEPLQTTTDANTKKSVTKFQYHSDAASVVSPHSFSYVVIQACIAILILVGFESVTAMGEEAKNAKRDIPRAVILSLLIQGLICYLIEYFAANYFLHNGYQVSNALGSAAPVGDMMVIAGTWLFGSAAAGKAFMLVQAFTVFLAIIGTTLSCMSTGARVTYAMGKDEELPDHYGLLHAENLTPHRSIWTLAILSAIIGIVCVSVAFGDGAAPKDADIKALPQGLLSSFGYTTHDGMAALPNTLLLVTLSSNFGTFLLYGLSCVICMVAFHKHPMYNPLKHMLIPLFGLIANIGC